MKIWLPSLFAGVLLLSGCGGSKGADRANALCDCVKNSVDLKNFTLAPGITTPDTLVVNILNNNNGTGTVNYTYKILSL